ncbi:MAG: hypothetical protein ACR2NN_12135, partial [Bryobacteraceae bacterium]
KRRQGLLRLPQLHLTPVEYPRPFSFHAVSLRAYPPTSEFRFNGLSLPAATYWITFGAPNPPTSYLLWAAANPATFTTGPGAGYAGVTELTGGSGPFPPGSPIFASFNNAFAYEFSVTTTPEPTTIGYARPVFVRSC